MGATSIHAGRILVTGADGFVGTALCRELIRRGRAVRGAQRQAAPLPAGCESVVVGGVGARTDWSAALEGVDRIVHLAARIHAQDPRAADSLAEFREVNVAGARCLAEAAAKAGVRRLVLLSTIKVNGAETETAYREGDVPAPADAYGTSKLEAELAMRGVEKKTGMEVVVIRSPLIYGAGVKGNFLSLLKLARSGLPLPLGAVRNRRSLIYLGNLVDFMVRCLDHPAAAHETFMISDGEDLSTPELLGQIRSAMNMPARMWPVQPSLLSAAAKLVRKKAMGIRLLGSLPVDGGKARKSLGWEPPYTVRQGLEETVAAFMGDGR